MGTSALANPSTARSSASNNHALSPLRRDPRPSTGQAPLGSFKSEARAHPASFGPARLLKTTCPSQGLRPSPDSGNGPPVRIINPAPGRPAISTLPHRCDGFYGLQPAGPAREFKLQARVHRCHPGPARLLKVTLSARVLRPRSRGRPVQSGSSAPHRVGLQSLLSAAPGSTVLNWPAPLGSSAH